MKRRPLLSNMTKSIDRITRKLLIVRVAPLCVARNVCLVLSKFVLSSCCKLIEPIRAYLAENFLLFLRTLRTFSNFIKLLSEPSRNCFEFHCGKCQEFREKRFASAMRQGKSR